MKYLRSFNESTNTSEIDAICEKYNIKHYTINEDGTVDVDGDVVLSRKNLDKLPLKFGKVTGDFYCDENKLINLDGSPYHVGGWFWCSNNDLITLEGGPKYVGSDFGCSSNKLKNVDYLPNRYKDLYINDNPIFNILKLFTNPDIIYYINYISSKNDKELIMDFNDREIIQNDILIIDRLVEFLEDINKPKSKEELYDLLENEYEIR